MLIRVCGSADEWIDGLLICKTSLFLDVQCYCDSTFFQTYRNPSCFFRNTLFCSLFFMVAVSGCETENVLLCFHNCSYINSVYLCFSSLQ